MQSARYFRDQAALCLEIARQMSDPREAQNFRGQATQYFARATELEAMGPLFGTRGRCSTPGLDASSSREPGTEE
jgi:hypothetical protein